MVDKVCQFLDLCVGEVGELHAAEPALSTGESPAFGQNADVVNAAAGDAREVKSIRSGPQNVDCPAFGHFSGAWFKLKGQPAFADVGQRAADLNAVAEDMELHIPDAVTRVLALLCFHVDPF